MLDKLTESCLFFRDSPKRISLLREMVTACMQDTNRRKVILDLFKTRHLMRQESWSHFYASFIFIVKALETLYEDRISNMFRNNWDPISKS